MKGLLPQTKIYFWEFHFWFNVKILYSKIIGMRFWECFFDRCLFSLQNLILIIHFIFCFCSTPHVRYRNFRVGVFFFYIFRFEVAITCRHFCIDKSKNLRGLFETNDSLKPVRSTWCIEHCLAGCYLNLNGEKLEWIIKAVKRYTRFNCFHFITTFYRVHVTMHVHP